MSVLSGFLTEFIVENSPTAQKVCDKLMEVTNNQRNLVEGKYAQY